MKNSRPVLLIEDDEVDLMTVRRAFEEISDVTQLVHTVDGEQALDYLKDYNNDRPGLILLDLNMPRMSGLEFLNAAKEYNILKRIPVVVLTTSTADFDVTECFDLGVSGYIVKPIGYRKFVEIIKTIHNYWSLSELPDAQTIPEQTITNLTADMLLGCVRQK